MADIKLNENPLNVRVLLKYDTYERWTDETVQGQGALLVLKKGEVGICSIPAGTDANGIQNPPHIIQKIGDGEHTFKDLPWTSAIAADVYAWAKQAGLVLERKDPEGQALGNVISSIGWDASGKLTYTTASVATSEGIGQLTGRVEAIENDYATNTALQQAVQAINGITLTTGTENGTVKFKGTDVAVAGLGTAAYKAEGDFATAAQGQKADSAVQSVAISTGTANGKIKLTVDGTDSEAEVFGLGTAAFTPASDYATAAQGTKADTAIQKITVLGKEITDGGLVSVDEAKTALGLKSAAYEEASAFDAAGAAAAVLGTNADEAGAETVHGALKAAAAAQADIDAFFSAAETGDAALDTLREIQDFLESDDGTVQTLIDKVDANEAAIGNIVDGTTTVAKATHAASATNADVAAKASGLDDSGVAAVKAVKVDSAAAADDAAKLGGVEAASYALKSDLTNGDITVAKAAVASDLDDAGKAVVKGVKVDNATAADTATTAETAETANKVANALTIKIANGDGTDESTVYDGSEVKEVAMAKVSKTGNISDLVQTEGTVILLDCGDSVRNTVS